MVKSSRLNLRTSVLDGVEKEEISSKRGEEGGEWWGLAATQFDVRGLDCVAVSCVVYAEVVVDTRLTGHVATVSRAGGHRAGLCDLVADG